MKWGGGDEKTETLIHQKSTWSMKDEAVYLGNNYTQYYDYYY